MIGAILVHNEALDLVMPIITADSFFRDAHKRIYRAIIALYEQRVAMDFVTLKEQLQRTGDLDECGGPAYVASLADGVPKATNAKFYAEIVAEKALRREVIMASSAILNDAYDEADGDAAALLRSADERLLGLSGRRYRSDLVPQSVSVSALAQALDRRVGAKDTLTGIDTGLTTLNEMTGGWQNGELIVVAARTSMGKTSLALGFAITAAKAGVPVAFFSLEMSRESVDTRILSFLSGVSGFRMQRGWLSKFEYQKLADAMNVQAALPLHVDDTAQISPAEVRSKSRRLRALHGCGLVVVDYIQLMTDGARPRGVTRVEELAGISHKMQGLAKELHVPVIVLAQLNRAPDNRPDVRPKLSDIRECGAIEQDAAVGLLIHRKDHKVGGECELLLEKQRNGPTGPFFVNFDPDITTFSNWVKPDVVPEEKPPTRPKSSRAPARRLPSFEAESAGGDMDS